MSAEAPKEGLAVIDKPSTWTSHDVVARCRGVLGTRKVGHAGTLDPMATGVLVLGIGRSTRLLRYLSGLPKTYEATIRLGVETDSLDADGAPTRTHDMDPPSPEAVTAAAAALTGDILQVPPMVSAIKVGGRRLHQLAREGKEVARDARAVTVSRFEVTGTDDPMLLSAVVDCSSGTYVRVLAADLGTALGGGAHLATLRRTAVGPFTLAEAHPLTAPVVLAPSAVTRVLPACTVGEDLATQVGHGKVLTFDQLGLDRPGPEHPGPQGGPWAVLDGTGDLLAVYEPHGPDTAKPAMVLRG